MLQVWKQNILFVHVKFMLGKMAGNTLNGLAEKNGFTDFIV